MKQTFFNRLYMKIKMMTMMMMMMKKVLLSDQASVKKLAPSFALISFFKVTWF